MRTLDLNLAYRGVPALVLGASGFVGRWVARALSARGAELFLVVRRPDSAQGLFRELGVSGRILQADLGDPASVRRLLCRVRPAITFNLAGYGVDPAQQDPSMAFQVNAGLVHSVCQAIAAFPGPLWPGRRIVHAGSALEYGSLATSLSEDSVGRPATLYGRSKLAGTLLLSRCLKRRRVAGLTARLFNVYGPGEHPGRLLPSLLTASRTDQVVPLTWGTQQRDFTYVEDVAEGLLRLGLSSGPPGQIVNLATGSLTPVRSFVETAAAILRIAPHRLAFGALPVRFEEIRHSTVNIDRLRTLLGWVPPADIAGGIERTLQFLPRAIAAETTARPVEILLESEASR